MSDLVSREPEIAEVRQLFDEGARVITLIGTAGVGKTRVAQELLGDEAVFVDLTGASSQDDIELSVAEALGASRAFGSRAEHICRVLAARGDSLVVLDNFEHLTKHAAATVQVWCGAAPQTRFLVTSRSRLRLRAETVVELRPLGVDGASNDDPSPSVELLLKRAREVDPGFELAQGELTLCNQIAQKLEGLPLALELAAPRLVSFGAAELLHRFEQSVSLLEGEMDPLAQAIAWSWDLLDEADQMAFAQCSVFQGGFELDAAEDVLALQGKKLAMDALQSLHDKSLLRSEHGRFGMLLSLRDFAASKLSESAEVFERHAKHYAELGARLAQGLDHEDAASCWKQLRLERDNLRLAAERSSDGEVTAQAVIALGPLFLVTGASAAAQELVANAIERSTSHASELLVQRSHVLFEAGKIDESEADLKRAARLAESERDARIESRVLRSLARVRYHRGDLEGAWELLEHSAIPRAEGSGHRLEAARSRMVLGTIAAALGNAEVAEAAYAEALPVFRSSGALREEAIVQGLQCILLVGTKRESEALVLAAQAEAIQERIGADSDAAFSRGLRGSALLARGDYEAAIATYEEAVADMERLGAARFIGHTKGKLALAMLLGGKNVEVAERLMLEAAEHAKQTSDIATEAVNRAFAGSCASRRGDLELARERLDEGAALAERSNDVLLQLAVRIQRSQIQPELQRALVSEASTKTSGGPPPAEMNLDVRLSLRLVEAAADTALPQPAPVGSSLLVDRKHHRITLPGAREHIELSHRELLCRILYALVDARNTPSGELTRQEVGAAGWPGEELAQSTLTNRVHVAIATLRKLGLHDIIVSRKSSYAIHPAVPLEEL